MEGTQKLIKIVNSMKEYLVDNLGMAFGLKNLQYYHLKEIVEADIFYGKPTRCLKDGSQKTLELGIVGKISYTFKDKKISIPEKEEIYKKSEKLYKNLTEKLN